jgi:hypothetical protein
MTDNVTIYEVIGWTARTDWSSSSDKKSLGLFVSEERAKDEIVLIKSNEDWYMDWEDKFTVEERTVLA